MARQIAYGILCFIIGLIVSIVALLVIVNNTEIRINDTLFFVLIGVISLGFGIIGAKIAGREENERPIGSYIVFGAFLGFIAAGWAIGIINDYSGIITSHIWLHYVILILGIIIGCVFGNLIGKRILDRKSEQGIQPTSTLFNFFKWFTYVNRRVEGNYIIYEVDKKRYGYLTAVLIVIGAILYRTNFEYWWVVVIAILIYLTIGGYSKSNDSLRAKSKKVIPKDNGRVEYWYQVE